MSDNDSHLAPAQPEPEERVSRFGLTPFVRDIGRFVRLAEKQGTRLVDIFERWVLAAEEGNRQVERLADAVERVGEQASAYMEPYEEEEDAKT